jgi:hypothetical protein
MSSRFASAARATCRAVARGAVIVAALVPLSAVAADGETISEQVDAVMSRAARLGMPVLAVASTDSCTEGPLLKQRLAADPILQPLVARFGLVELRMSGDDRWTWKRWQEHFDTHRRQSPQVFVVRADGKKMFSGDPPADLVGFLHKHLAQCGQAIVPRQAQLFESQLEAASQLQAAGDLAAAVRAVTPAARVPSHARPVVQSIAFRAAVTKRLLASIERLAIDPAAGADSLAAAEELVALGDEYATTLPDVARAARERTALIGREPAGREMVRQAQLLRRAAVAARRSADRGLALYEQIIATDPDSPAAELAAVRLRSIDHGPR